MRPYERTQKAIDLVLQFCPKYKVVYKRTSFIHRAIGKILSWVGNKAYMTSYVTTLGQTTALPEGLDITQDENVWFTILHEGRHAIDSKKMSNLLFGLAYLFPQLLGILAILVFLAAMVLAPLGILSPWWLLSLGAIVFVSPFPAPFRMWAELRGYMVTMACQYWCGTLTPEREEEFYDFLREVFYGGGYYYMVSLWTSSKFVRRYFAKRLGQLKTNQLHLDAYLAACKTLSKEIN